MMVKNALSIDKLKHSYSFIFDYLKSVSIVFFQFAGLWTKKK
jgi:hypothetical protein